VKEDDVDIASDDPLFGTQQSTLRGGDGGGGGTTNERRRRWRRRNDDRWIIFLDDPIYLVKIPVR
jgi:hypothetical protein